MCEQWECVCGDVCELHFLLLRLGFLAESSQLLCTFQCSAFDVESIFCYH